MAAKLLLLPMRTLAEAANEVLEAMDQGNSVSSNSNCSYPDNVCCDPEVCHACTIRFALEHHREEQGALAELIEGARQLAKHYTWNTDYAPDERPEYIDFVDGMSIEDRLRDLHLAIFEYDKASAPDTANVITRSCDECGGSGEVESSCTRCGVLLTNFNVGPGVGDECVRCIRANDPHVTKRTTNKTRKSVKRLSARTRPL